MIKKVKLVSYALLSKLKSVKSPLHSSHMEIFKIMVAANTYYIFVPFDEYQERLGTSAYFKSQRLIDTNRPIKTTVPTRNSNPEEKHTSMMPIYPLN